MYMILSQLTLCCSYYFVHTAHHALVCDTPSVRGAK